MASIPGIKPLELSLTVNPIIDPIFAIEYAFARIGVIRTAPPGREDLMATPVWELLSATGVGTAVVDFPFTYPAAGQASVVISDRISPDIFGLLNVRPGDAAKIVSPSSETDKWRRWFSADRKIGTEALLRILPEQNWPQPGDATLNPASQLHDAWDLSTRSFDASEEIRRTHPDLPVMMTFISGLDTVSHAFWQYRFPEQYAAHSPSQRDVQVLGPVLDRYLMYVDERIGSLIATMPPETTVLIVSDHGHEASTGDPLWRDAHSGTGIFIAAGPRITHGTNSTVVSYYDVVPTILDLEGFEIPRSLRGQTRVQRLDRDR